MPHCPTPRRRSSWTRGLAFLAASGQSVTGAACHHCEPCRPPAAAVAPSGGQPALSAARRNLLTALASQKPFTDGRMIAHVAHVCDVHVEGRTWSVVDVRQLVKGAATPRGVNSILLVDESFNVLRVIPYAVERPLFCRANRLYLAGPLRMDDFNGEGSEITFSGTGDVVKLTPVEANDVPAPTVPGDVQ